ncbi:hypothetical protein [Arthrobacter sp. OY3WO11]|nr:hypothetical protein [Arthrobacter sp. OY3WO11]
MPPLMHRHLHEPGQLGLFGAQLILERTKALGMQGVGRVVADALQLV